MLDRRTDPTYDANEWVGVDKMFNLPQMAIGLGLGALAAGLYYRGPAIFDQSFAVKSAGYAAAILIGYALITHDIPGLDVLRSLRSPPNRGRVFIHDGGTLRVADVRMDDPKILSCADLLDDQPSPPAHTAL